MSKSTRPTPTAEEFILAQKEKWKGNTWVKAKDIMRNGHHFLLREAVTFHVQTDHPQKVLFIERIRWQRFDPSNEGEQPRRKRTRDDVEYRFAYYIVNRSGRWWFGQYAPMIPHKDLALLLRKAREEGMLLGEEISP